MGFSKGSAVLSESVLATISVIISLLLIVLFANSTFSYQSKVAFRESLNSVGRDISMIIDRACGLAGSTKILYEHPKGLHTNISIEYKYVFVRSGEDFSSNSFACMRAIPASFKDPKKLCIVKNRDDRKVIIFEGECICKINDGKCDPACVADNICDPDCYRNSEDNVCNKFCVKDNDGICDPDCYRNESDNVWDLDCRKEEKDGICDPDSGIEDGFCDPDCYVEGSKVCDPDCKPKDEDNDKEEDQKDGFCYAACVNKTINFNIQEKSRTQSKKYNIIQNYSCTSSSDWRNARCADGISIYSCGNYIGTCRDRCSDEVLCEGDDCLLPGGGSRKGGWCHAQVTTPLNLSKEVCCCDSSGKCWIEKSIDCILNYGGQTYRLPHPYCEGLSVNERESESGSAKSELKSSKTFLLPDGICDKDCEEENGICDPDCTKDKDCEMQCAKLGENCSQLDPCPGAGICCPGDKIVRENCCGNEICETREMWVPGNETKWENFYTCRQDCTNLNDSVCARVLNTTQNNSGCDFDCLNKFNRFGASDYMFCDPECSGSEFNANGICPIMNNNNQSIQDNICLEIEDNVCDPDCVNFTDKCDPDCCPFNSNSPCPSSPGCYCPERVKKGSFTGAFWFSETSNNPNCNEHEPQMTNGVIEVCSQEAINFLNRRGWDIKELARSIVAPTPEGFSFDFSRYITITREGVQKASKTLKANDEYNLSSSCCCTSDCPCGTCEATNMCCGIGFCGDHAVGILSALRTLGVPAKNVFATFTGSAPGCGRHSFVVYKCDPSMPENLKLEECDGNWNEWLIIDATAHVIKPLRNSGECENMCIWFNDYGPYPTIDPSVHGFGGKLDSNTGRPFPQETGCRVGGACAMQKVCNLFGINCV